jgi:adenine-specific DNA-methyltransferase
MFENASVDVILFRYHKHIASSSLRTVLYNGKPLHIINSEGLITVREEEEPGGDSGVLFQEYFDIYVGLVSGKEDVYKHDVLGNIEVLNAENKIDRYIYIEKYPCENAQINAYLLLHKNALMERRIRKFNENNWFEWGAPRNIAAINSNLGRDCIYICTLTRTPNVAFLGKVRYFGGGLIMLKPKKTCNLNSVLSYINSSKFKENFIVSRIQVKKLY